MKIYFQGRELGDVEVVSGKLEFTGPGRVRLFDLFEDERKPGQSDQELYDAVMAKLPMSYHIQNRLVSDE